MGDYAVWLPVLDAGKTETYLRGHIAYLDGLREQGTVVANGRLADGSGGLVIYRAESEEAVKRLVENDPFVVHGVRGYEIREWLAKWGPGYDGKARRPNREAPGEGAIGEISPAELRERLARGERPAIVDVREDDEVAQGILPGAIHIRLGDLPTRLDDLPDAPEVLFVCRGGRRSLKACELLRELGYGGLVNVAGGMTAWNELA